MPVGGIPTDAGRGLSKDVRMVAAESFQSGLSVLRQVGESMFEMRLYVEKNRQGSAQSCTDEPRVEAAVA